MNKKLSRGALSIILVIMMITTLLPIQVFAESGGGGETSAVTYHSNYPDGFDDEQPFVDEAAEEAEPLSVLEGLPAGWGVEGYAFTGWYDASVGGAKISGSVTSNIALYAHWLAEEGAEDPAVQGEKSDLEAKEDDEGDDPLSENEGDEGAVENDEDDPVAQEEDSTPVTEDEADSPAAEDADNPVIEEPGNDPLLEENDGNPDAALAAFVLAPGGFIALASSDFGTYAVQYHVSYYANASDVEGADPSDSNEYDLNDPATILSNTWTREGYTFAGWNTQTGGAGTAYAPGASVAMQTDLHLYAQWEPVVPSATHNWNSVWSSVAPLLIGAANLEMYMESPSEKNYIDYIYYNPDTNVLTVLVYTTHNQLNNRVNALTVSDGTGGSSIAGTLSWVGGQDNYYKVFQFNLPESGLGNLVLKDGFSGKGQSTGFGSSGSIIPYTVFHVLYSGNGQDSGYAPTDGTPYNPSGTNKTATVLGNTGNLAKAGYVFAGWSTSPGGSVDYVPGDTFAVTSNVTLYAVWEVDPTVGVTITVTGNSTETTYDGLPHSATGFDANAPTGFSVTAVTTDPSATNVADSPKTNTVSNVKVFYDSVDVTSRVTVNTVDGILKINPRSATITADDAYKFYAESDPAFTFTAGGFLTGDEPAATDYTVTRPGVGTDEAVGDYPAALEVTDNGSYTNSNYTITLVKGDFEIRDNTLFDTVTIIVTGNSTETTYDSLPHSATGYTSSASETGFTITATTSDPSATNVTTLPNTVSNVTITYNGFDVTSLIDAANITVIDGQLKINPAFLTITTSATPATITQGDAAPAYNIGVTGLVAGDSILTLFPSLAASSVYNAATNNAPGPYPVTLSPAAPTAANYTVRVINGSFTVLAPPVVPLTYTVTFIDWNGAMLGTSTGAPGFNATAPVSPARAGYTFTGWSTGFTNVNGNITVVAIYTPIPAPVVPFVPAVVVPAAPDPAPAAPILTPIPDDPTPLAPAPTQEQNISDPEPPLAAPDGTWALLNLILAIIAIICAFALIVGLATGKRKKEQTGQSDQENKNKNGHLWRALGIVFGIASPVVFALTENIMLRMIIVDQWTILMAVITVLQVTSMIVLRKIRQDRNETQNAQA
ncbi:MAG: InlB B-repeat-containing protein [Coriobacteriales bacterium]|jgi:uncharacterized repeat protein (TIGR02543 family)|nr:InlB B-repeat-containing protein [Coriobacteriales bacterium]